MNLLANIIRTPHEQQQQQKLLCLRKFAQQIAILNRNSAEITVALWTIDNRQAARGVVRAMNAVKVDFSLDFVEFLTFL